MKNELCFVSRIPSLAEFKALRQNAGWGMPPDADIERALNNTVHAVCIETSDGKTVGMGRIVGDGGVQFFITDIIIAKEFQKQGLGTQLMTILMQYIQERVNPGTFIGLFAAKNLDSFYERFGFFTRPNAYFGPGMMYILQKNSDKENDSSH